MRRLTIVAIAAFTFSSSAAAVPTCGMWVSQTNGSSWRLCKDAQTQARFCEVKRGGTIRRMVCP